ncbi:uncharacterized protein [Nicotiana tomentosiformis]|uniref:uncharacterized protein n=1 Tax=Nicotiana tomentosiformis TaxID=4098 RepID=UPI00388C5B5B
MPQFKKDVVELKLELHKMQTLEFDLTTLLPVEGEHGTDTFQGAGISQTPGSVAHANDHLDEEFGESREETDEEKISEEGDDPRDNRGKPVTVSTEELGKDEADVKTAITHSLVDMISMATTMTTQPSSGEASNSQVQDPASQLAEPSTLVPDTTVQSKDPAIASIVKPDLKNQEQEKDDKNPWKGRNAINMGEPEEENVFVDIYEYIDDTNVIVPPRVDAATFKKESSSSESKLENMLERVLQNQERSDTSMKNMTELVGSHTASIQRLEMQMRDFSREQNPKKKSTLPSDTIANPKAGGSGPTSHCMAITTRSGKLLQGENEQVVEGEDSEQEVEEQIEVPNIVEVERLPKKVKDQDVNREEVKEKVIEAPKPLSSITRHPPPFPQRLARRVDDSKLEKFYDILK